MGFKKTYQVEDVHSSIESSTTDTKESTQGNDEKHRNSSGMHWVTAAIFIVGDMMGGGMIALPIAVLNTGFYAGMTLLILAALFSGYTGLQLGWSWTMMQQRWSDYQSHCRRPYPEIAYRALGSKAKVFVSICLVVTQYGIVTVLTLLASKNLANFVDTFFHVNLDFCFMILLIGLFVWPFTMLKSPMDFWQAAIASAVSSTLAAGIIIAGTVHDSPVCKSVVTHGDFKIKDMFLGYGTIVFAYGGHGAFPTIQHDMKKPFRFNRSVISSYIFILCVYISVSAGGFWVYGDSMVDTIIPSLQVKWMSQAVNIMITLHIIPTIIIVFSPLAQQIEEWARVPHNFSWKRFVARTVILFVCIFTAESVPNFGVFLDLVGGSTITLMTMLLPSVFYLFMNASYKKRKEMILQGVIDSNSPDTETAGFRDVLRYNSKHVLAFNLISLLFGLIGGIASSTAAVSALISSDMAAPCYVQWIRHGFGLTGSDTGSTHCCGFFKNITVTGQDPHGFCVL